MTAATAETSFAAKTATGPLQPAQRSVALDIIRGIAVFGLVWVNFNARPKNGLDRVAVWIILVFAAGKFYTMFSTLFGVTLAMQLERARAAGHALTWRWIRRMAVLYAIGYVNLFFVWGGDILRWYAIAGLALLLFAHRSGRTLLVTAAALLLLSLPRESLSVVTIRLTGGDVGAAKARGQSIPMDKITPFDEALRRGTYVDVVRTHMQAERAITKHRSSQPPAGPLNLFPMSYLALFLIGLWAGRRGIVQEPDAHATFLRRVAIVGGAVGLTLAMFTATGSAFLRLPVGSTNTSYGRLLDDLSQPMLSFAYLSALLLLLRRPAWTQRLRWLAAVGRMGLTCYIMQWGIISFIRFNYGLGLESKLGQAACTVLATLIFVVQVVFANWWLKRFSYGPIEWLWRVLSYGRFRKSVVVPSPAIS
jgi:uncharacterized protein